MELHLEDRRGEAVDPDALPGQDVPHRHGVVRPRTQQAPAVSVPAETRTQNSQSKHWLEWEIVHHDKSIWLHHEWILYLRATSWYDTEQNRWK